MSSTAKKSRAFQPVSASRKKMVRRDKKTECIVVKSDDASEKENDRIIKKSLSVKEKDDIDDFKKPKTKKNVVKKNKKKKEKVKNDGQKIEEKKSGKKKPQLTAKDLSGDTVSDVYLELLAEERQSALQETLKQNEALHHQIDYLINTNKNLEPVADRHDGLKEKLEEYLGEFYQEISDEPNELIEPLDWNDNFLPKIEKPVTEKSEKRDEKDRNNSTKISWQEIAEDRRLALLEPMNKNEQLYLRFRNLKEEYLRLMTLVLRVNLTDEMINDLLKDDSSDE